VQRKANKEQTDERRGGGPCDDVEVVPALSNDLVWHETQSDTRDELARASQTGRLLRPKLEPEEVLHGIHGVGCRVPDSVHGFADSFGDRATRLREA